MRELRVGRVGADRGYCGSRGDVDTYEELVGGTWTKGGEKSDTNQVGHK